MAKKVTFASGLVPDWNSKGNAAKETLKKRTHVQISAGGLEDSDAEADNPFHNFKDRSKAHSITEDELKKGTLTAKRDLSRRNEVCIYSNFELYNRISNMNAACVP